MNRPEVGCNVQYSIIHKHQLNPTMFSVSWSELAIAMNRTTLRIRQRVRARDHRTRAGRRNGITQSTGTMFGTGAGRRNGITQSTGAMFGTGAGAGAGAGTISRSELEMGLESTLDRELELELKSLETLTPFIDCSCANVSKF